MRYQSGAVRKPLKGTFVTVYFRPRGAVAFRYLYDLRTDRNGHFDDRTTATADGTWAVSTRFDGLSHYLDSNKPTDYVDVR